MIQSTLYLLRESEYHPLGWINYDASHVYHLYRRFLCPSSYKKINIIIVLLRIFHRGTFDAFEGVDYSFFFFESIDRIWYFLKILHLVQRFFTVEKLTKGVTNKFAREHIDYQCLFSIGDDRIRNLVVLYDPCKSGNISFPCIEKTGTALYHHETC